MWNALKSKLGRIFHRKTKHSVFTEVAVEKGFMTEKQADEAAMLRAEHLDDTSHDLFVDHGLVSGSEAEIIALDVKRRSPSEHLADQFKEASKAVDDTGAIHLSEIATAIKNKK